jgi:hypothetical protein
MKQKNVEMTFEALMLYDSIKIFLPIIKPKE